MTSMSLPSSYPTMELLTEAENLLNKFTKVKTLNNLDNNFTTSSSNLDRTRANAEFNKKDKFFQLPPIKENSPMAIKDNLQLIIIPNKSIICTVKKSIKRILLLIKPRMLSTLHISL